MDLPRSLPGGRRGCPRHPAPPPRRHGRSPHLAARQPRAVRDPASQQGVGVARPRQQAAREGRPRDRQRRRCRRQGGHRRPGRLDGRDGSGDQGVGSRKGRVARHVGVHGRQRLQVLGRGRPGRGPSPRARDRRRARAGRPPCGRGRCRRAGLGRTRLRPPRPAGRPRERRARLRASRRSAAPDRHRGAARPLRPTIGSCERATSYGRGFSRSSKSAGTCACRQGRSCPVHTTPRSS